MADLPTIPLARVRLAGRAPRLALMATCAAVTVTCAVRTLAPVAPAVQANHQPAPADTTAEQGLAERFATEYLSFRAGGEAHRETRLYGLGLADTATPAERLGDRSRQVTATSIAAVRRVARGADVTVAVLTDGRWRYLAVPVRRDAGRLFVAGPPAVVGSPPVATDMATEPEDEVQSVALKRVAERAMRHYLAGDRTDLSADLDPRARVATPLTDLRVAGVEAVTWSAAPRRVAVLLRTRGAGGLRLTLRYELGVVRRDGRWLVTGIADSPTNEEHP